MVEEGRVVLLEWTCEFGASVGEMKPILALTAYGSHYSPRDSPANESISKRYSLSAGEFITRASEANELLEFGLGMKRISLLSIEECLW